MTSDLDPLCLDNPQSALWKHIATYICRNSQPHDALSLAETSPVLRDAVLEILSHTICITAENSDLLPRWDAIARDCVQTLSFCSEQTTNSAVDWSQITAPLSPSIFNLLRAPALKRVEIYDERTMLTALQDSPTVQELLVRIEGLAPTSLLRCVIQSLGLHRLELECHQSTIECPIQDLHFTSSILSSYHEHAPFALHPPNHTWCRNLRSLRINCSAPQHPDYLADYIPLFPNLVEVTVGNVGRSFQEAYPLQFLQRLTSVRIIHARRGFGLALNLAHRVTALHFCQRALSSSDLSQLSACPNICDLRVNVFYGTDDALRNMLTTLRKLTILELCWEKPRRPRTYRLGRILRRPHTEFSLSDGFLSTALTKDTTPNLKELQLIGVMSNEELSNILRNMGHKLTAFVVSVCKQGEKPLGRAAHVLASLALNCPELRVFKTFDDLGSLREHDNPDLCNDARQVLASLRLLQQRAPHLNAEAFERSVRSLIIQNNSYQPVITPVQSQDIDP